MNHGVPAPAALVTGGGRTPAPFEFTPVDMPPRPDGSVARLRPFLTARP